MTGDQLLHPAHARHQTLVKGVPPALSPFVLVLVYC